MSVLCACGCGRQLDAGAHGLATYRPECRKHQARDSRRRARKAGLCVNCRRPSSEGCALCRECRDVTYMRNHDGQLVRRCAEEGCDVIVAVAGEGTFYCEPHAKQRRTASTVASTRRRRRARRAHGECVRCGAASQRYLCDQCWSKVRAWYREHNGIVDRKGPCSNCGEIGHYVQRCPRGAQ